MDIQSYIAVRSSPRNDQLAKALTKLATYFLWLSFSGFFFYIFFEGLKSFYSYSFQSIFLSREFKLSESGASFWAPFGVTLFLVLIAVLLTIPIAIRCSVFITFHLSEGNSRFINTVVLLLANIPSVVLGVFVKTYFPPIFKTLPFFDTQLNLITASIALVLMILPLVISLFNAALENQKVYLNSAQVLGISRRESIYKTLLPRIRRTVWVSITIISSRALSESVMLSMILSSSNYSAAYEDNMRGFLNSSLNPIAPLISENFFSDGSSESIKNLMFLFGGLLLVTSLVINALCYQCMKREPTVSISSSKLSSRIKLWLLRLGFPKSIDLRNGLISLNEYIYLSQRHYFWRHLRESVYKFLEWVCIGILFLFATSLILSILIDGLTSISQWDNFTPDFGTDSLGRAIINTFFIVVLSIFITVPISLAIAVHLSEYSRDSRIKKYTLYLINAASATPSIIFGIFGLSFFIYQLELTSNGASGRSILAGVLTISLLILPYMTQLFYTNISSVSYKYRESSYLLGMDKYQTLVKIILPIATVNLIFSILLSIGKIMGETAPLYLTSGMNSIYTTLLFYPGQTLTTRIYAQIYENNISKGENLMAEASFCCLVALMMIILMGRYIIPYLMKLFSYPLDIWIRYYGCLFFYYWKLGWYHMKRMYCYLINRFL
ncbi:Phosphate ABC transporter, permease protein PstA [Mycoplasma haemocanis str. Illinois]|uniref:Phosphate ABC transporter, permease protein PstA n=1 Tax=Mycoplasma haemocanis (strain Illinois) TaxID=1111676 RepID=H6N7U7_MYCHN|nr:ABC transporter permease subunit [Mycoplasma haemocanis]AEW45719.1 Phosphate ABC transporter, permease protein PstA [Mycoplasma haemocanis str. Illinois]